MALVTCPECGASISDTALQCIHCGCRLQRCPECETILKADAVQCPECGFALHTKKEKEPPQEELPSYYQVSGDAAVGSGKKPFADQPQLVQDWAKGAMWRMPFLRFYPTVKKLLILCGWVMFCVTFIRFFIYSASASDTNYKDLEGALSKLGEVFNYPAFVEASIRTFLWSLILVFLGMSVEITVDLYLKHALSSWFISARIDCLPDIRRYLREIPSVSKQKSVTTSKQLKELVYLHNRATLLVDSAMLRSNYFLQMQLYLNYAGEVLYRVIWMGGGFFLLKKIIGGAAKSFFYSEIVDFDAIFPLSYIIIYFVALLVAAIIVRRGGRKANKLRTAWIKQVMPEDTDLHTILG